MILPSQGFRHAVTLLLTNSSRAIGADASPEALRAEVARLAHALVSLADDMRAPADSAAWLTAELNATIDRLPHSFDRYGAKAEAAGVLAHVASRTPHIVRRDVFLVHVPEDRLPVAAPLAVELTKRRVSVAFAEYEVETAERLTAAVASGLAHHRGGVILQTRAFDRREWPSITSSDRIRIITYPMTMSSVSDLVNWACRLRLSKI
ncbi:MAG TPA: hypothetical protein VM115_08940 [Vicinamibacterales bacterium]|nr:hypothetical protein [Vicinamibacterales bacterium]